MHSNAFLCYFLSQKILISIHILCILISVAFLVQLTDSKNDENGHLFCCALYLYFYLTQNCESLTYFGAFCLIVMPLAESLDSPFYTIKVNKLIAKRQLTESSVLVLF